MELMHHVTPAAWVGKENIGADLAMVNQSFGVHLNGAELPGDARLNGLIESVVQSMDPRLKSLSAHWNSGHVEPLHHSLKSLQELATALERHEGSLTSQQLNATLNAQAVFGSDARFQLDWLSVAMGLPLPKLWATNEVSTPLRSEHEPLRALNTMLNDLSERIWRHTIGRTTEVPREVTLQA